MRKNKIKAENTKCLLASRNRRRRCFAVDCNVKAIKSHILWKKGVLDTIAEKSHLVELNVDRNHNYESLKFKKTGINKILSFSGFCNFHDSKIFKEIEKDDVNFKFTNNQILVSIRSIFFERVKKEQNVEYFQCLLKKNTFLHREQMEFLKNEIHVQNLGIKDMIFYIDELNQEYIDSKGRFVFKYFEIEQLPVACSCIFSVDSKLKMHLDSKSNSNWQNEPLNSIIFNVFPNNKKSIVIFGYHTNYLGNVSMTNAIENLTNQELKELVSNILLERSESWVCTPSFYDSNIKKREGRIITDFNNPATTFTGAVNKHLINMFEVKNV